MKINYERKLIEGKELREAKPDEVKEWGRLRRALINLKYEAIGFKDGIVKLYDGELAILASRKLKTYFIVNKSEVSKILKTLPLDTNGEINKKKYNAVPDLSLELLEKPRGPIMDITGKVKTFD